MRDDYVPVEDPMTRYRLNEASSHADMGKRELRDAIERLESIEQRWSDGTPPDSISFNNAAGRVVDAAWHCGAMLAIVRSAPGADDDMLLAAIQGRTYFTEPS
jgi:hypothetical protein